MYRIGKIAIGRQFPGSFRSHDLGSIRKIVSYHWSSIWTSRKILLYAFRRWRWQSWEAYLLISSAILFLSSALPLRIPFIASNNSQNENSDIYYIKLTFQVSSIASEEYIYARKSAKIQFSGASFDDDFLGTSLNFWRSLRFSNFCSIAYALIVFHFLISWRIFFSNFLDKHDRRCGLCSSLLCWIKLLTSLFIQDFWISDLDSCFSGKHFDAHSMKIFSSSYRATLLCDWRWSEHCFAIRATLLYAIDRIPRLIYVYAEQSKNERLHFHDHY